MNTKCTVIGQETSPAKDLKLIEFKYLLNLDKPNGGDEITESGKDKPSHYKYIELICKNYVANDLMFAHNGDRSNGILYMGKWNDGVVA